MVCINWRRHATEIEVIQIENCKIELVSAPRKIVIAVTTGGV